MTCDYLSITVKISISAFFIISCTVREWGHQYEKEREKKTRRQKWEKFSRLFNYFVSAITMLFSCRNIFATSVNSFFYAVKSVPLKKETDLVIIWFWINDEAPKKKYDLLIVENSCFEWEISTFARSPDVRVLKLWEVSKLSNRNCFKFWALFCLNDYQVKLFGHFFFSSSSSFSGRLLLHKSCSLLGLCKIKLSKD